MRGVRVLCLLGGLMVVAGSGIIYRNSALQLGYPANFHIFQLLL